MGRFLGGDSVLSGRGEWRRKSLFVSAVHRHSIRPVTELVVDESHLKVAEMVPPFMPVDREGDYREAWE